MSELSMGFENAYDISDFKETEFYGLGLTDESFFKQVIPRLKEEKTPFYSFWRGSVISRFAARLYKKRELNLFRFSLFS